MIQREAGPEPLAVDNVVACEPCYFHVKFIRQGRALVAGASDWTHWMLRLARKYAWDRRDVAGPARSFRPA